jgi:Uma2 family endonuclease
LYCLDCGSRLGWFLDPDDASILVFKPQQQPRLYRGDAMLPVLEEIPLQLTVDRVYAWLKMP